MATDTVSKRIDRLFEQEKWGSARRLIERELAKLPPGDWMVHWWLTRLSTTYYEERDYEKARDVVWKAYQIAPDCPLVLWDLAGTLDMLGDKLQAIDFYSRLIKRGSKAIANDQCGEGIEWANSLITDSWFRRGLCHEEIGQYAEALRSATVASRRLSQGSESIYTSKEIVEMFGRVYTRVLSNYGEKLVRQSNPLTKGIPTCLPAQSPSYFPLPSRISRMKSVEAPLNTPATRGPAYSIAHSSE